MIYRGPRPTKEEGRDIQRTYCEAVGQVVPVCRLNSLEMPA